MLGNWRSPLPLFWTGEEGSARWGIKDTFIHSTGGMGPKSPPQDLITLSSFSHWHVVARHSQPNLCLHEQAWQRGSGSKRPLPGLLTHTDCGKVANFIIFFKMGGLSLNVCLTRKVIRVFHLENVGSLQMFSLDYCVLNASPRHLAITVQKFTLTFLTQVYQVRQMWGCLIHGTHPIAEELTLQNTGQLC